jgi:dihydrofolate reductase
MRHVIFQPFVSLDGFAAGPNDSTDFVPASNKGDQSFMQRQLEFMDSVDAILLGRVTYEMFAGYWPKATSGDDKEFAEKINAIPKIVFSKTLQRAPWGNFEDAIIKRDAVTEIEKLKRESGKDMVIWGSISLGRRLEAEGVIDEYQIIVCPVILGRGKRLFGDEGDAFDLSLRESRPFDRGAVLLAYSPARAHSGAGGR